MSRVGSRVITHFDSSKQYHNKTNILYINININSNNDNNTHNFTTTNINILIIKVLKIYII